MNEVVLDRRRSRRVKHGPFVFLAVAPFLLFAVVLVAYPLAQVVRMSFSEIGLGPRGFEFGGLGLDNYIEVLGASETWRAIANTGIFLAATVPGTLLAGLGLALLVHRSVRLLPVARNVMIWPAIIAPVVVSLIWLLILNPTAGGLNKLLGSLGLPEQTWLDSAYGAMLSVMLVDIWHWTPVVFLFLYTALQGISADLLEAARVDGASERQLFRHVVLPLLAPTISAVAAVRVIQGIKAFDEMYLLTAGGPNGATTLISQRVQIWFFADLKFGDASAFSVVVVLLTAVVVSVFLFIRSRLSRRAG